MELVINGRFLLQPITGVQRVAYEFVNSLDALIEAGEVADISVVILLPQKGDIVAPLSLKHVQVRRVGRFGGHLWEQLELPRYAGKRPLLCLGNLAPVWRLHARKGPTVTMVHDLAYKYFPSSYSFHFRLLYSMVMPQVLSRSDYVVTVSESERSSIFAHYPQYADDYRIMVAPNGSISGDEVIGGGVLSVDERQPVGLYVGSLTKRKNAHGLLKAGIRLVREDGLKMVFIGGTATGFEDVNLAIPDDVRSSFIFLGQINDSERIYNYYRNSKVFLFPSLYESSGLPPAEAMALGLPVVASSIPSLRERCGDGAVYCDPTDADSIVTAVRCLLSDPALWSNMQVRGLAKAATYSWRQQVRDVLALVRKSCGPDGCND